MKIMPLVSVAKIQHEIHARHVAEPKKLNAVEFKARLNSMTDIDLARMTEHMSGSDLARMVRRGFIGV